MPLDIQRSSMVFVERIEVWTSGCASLREIAVLVDVKSVDIIRLESSNVSNDFTGSSDVFLGEGDEARDSGVIVWVKNADCVAGSGQGLVGGWSGLSLK